MTLSMFFFFHGNFCGKVVRVLRPEDDKFQIIKSALELFPHANGYKILNKDSNSKRLICSFEWDQGGLPNGTK